MIGLGVPGAATGDPPPAPRSGGCRGARTWRSLPGFALLAGLAFIADAVVLGTDGFTASVPNLISWAAFILFAVTATIAAWWRHSKHQPAPVADRGH